MNENTHLIVLSINLNESNQSKVKQSKLWMHFENHVIFILTEICVWKEKKSK